jgi:hypothetical protein
MGSEWTIINSIAYLSDSCKRNIKTCNFVYMGIIWLQSGQYSVFEI